MIDLEKSKKKIEQLLNTRAYFQIIEFNLSCSAFFAFYCALWTLNILHVQYCAANVVVSLEVPFVNKTCIDSSSANFKSQKWQVVCTPSMLVDDSWKTNHDVRK